MGLSVGTGVSVRAIDHPQLASCFVTEYPNRESPATCLVPRFLPQFDEVGMVWPVFSPDLSRNSLAVEGVVDELVDSYIIDVLLTRLLDEFAQLRNQFRLV